MDHKPVILISTGAWHPPACYADLQSHLEADGFEVSIPQHPSMGGKAHGIAWKADKDNLVKIAESYFAAGKEVVLISHSYGGVPAGAATEGQGIREREERGLKGGFRDIIFIASFDIPVRGSDLLTTFGGEWPDWQTTGPKYTGGHLSIPNEQAIPLLYNDASDEEAQRAFDMLLPHSQDAFETGGDFIAADITIKKTFLICESDKVFPPEVQEQLVLSTPGMNQARMAAGHSPFIGRARETASKLVEIIEGTAQ